MFIYIIKNMVNGKMYVGKTIGSVDRRCYKHVHESFNEKLDGYNFAFHIAIRKYGVKSFQLYEIHDYSNDNISESKLGQLETDFIKKYRTFVKFPDCNGYNLTLGGEGISGAGISVDVYNKQLQYITTYISIEETARKLNLQASNIQAVIKGRFKSAGDYIFCESGDIPRPFIDEQKVVIDIYDLDLNLVKICESMRSAALYIGVNPTTVFDCCNQKQLKCKNYICVYHGDDIYKRRTNLTIKSIDLYNSKTKEFIKTYPTITSLVNAKLGFGKGTIQRCLRTNNHLAGDYLIIPHGTKLTE